MTRRAGPSGGRRRGPAGDAQWYLDAVIYELHVRSFRDSNGDGIGDFRGLTQCLPYVRDLGVTAVWLLPFYASPLQDDGYDIADYTAVHPDYGTVADFCGFLHEAHRLGLRVITELVINHTSDRHAWFQRARTAAPGTSERDFYVWSDSPDRYGEARVIFPDFERSNWTWDPKAGAYYWHRFYAHQPDLNYDNPDVLAAILGVLDYWFALGVDGMRLDAVPYLVERDGTSSENLRETHQVVKGLRRHVDAKYAHRIFIAEANQWPEDAAAYFGVGDESHMVFHFPLMPRLFMALRQEDRFPILDILAQTPATPPGCQWALFLRNHDELTLEMVTEEERLYMYQVYAADPHARLNLGIRRRLAPLLGNDRRRIELLHGLLLSLQGTPVLYYGDEIGMGDNIYLGDRNGVRTPMQWSGDRNAGFSEASAQRLFLPVIVEDEFHYTSVHVAQQRHNPSSLLSWVRRLIAARRGYQAFGRGDLVLIGCDNRRVLAFLRVWGEQQVLVIANLSRFVQFAALQLEAFEDRIPVEVFGRTPFPPIGRTAYPVTLAPHAFMWMELTPAEAREKTASAHLEVEHSWDELFVLQGQGDLEAVLARYIERNPAWNTGGRAVLSVNIEDAIPLGTGERRRWLTLLHVNFASGEPECCLLPLGCRQISGRAKQAAADAVLDLTIRDAPGRHQLFDAAEDPVLAAELVTQLVSGGVLRGAVGRIDVAEADGEHHPGADVAQGVRQVTRARRGANVVVELGGRLALKLFRVIDSGPPLEVEMRARLQRVGFRHTPRVVAAFRWRRNHDDDSAAGAWLGLLQEFVPNRGEAWHEAVTAAEAFLERASRLRREPPPVSALVPTPGAGTPDRSGHAASVDALLGPYVPVIEHLALRTAELHQALGDATPDPEFTPEPFTAFSRRSLYQRMRRLALMVLDDVASRAPAMDDDLRARADAAMHARGDALALFATLLEQPLRSARIRCHGNLHLGQVLRAGNRFVIIDFDGEPGRPVYERRLKQSPLHDIATMVRSFHYAAHAAHAGMRQRGRSRRTASASDAWRLAWQSRAGAIFVEAYWRAMASSGLLPEEAGEARVLLRTFLLERTFYEIGYELNHRSEWVRAPLTDLPRILERQPPAP